MPPIRLKQHSYHAMARELGFVCQQEMFLILGKYLTLTQMGELVGVRKQSMRNKYIGMGMKPAFTGYWQIRIRRPHLWGKWEYRFKGKKNLRAYVTPPG